MTNIKEINVKNGAILMAIKGWQRKWAKHNFKIRQVAREAKTILDRKNTFYISINDILTYF